MDSAITLDKLKVLQDWATQYNITNLDAEDTTELLQLTELELMPKNGQYMKCDHIPAEIGSLENLTSLIIHLPDLQVIPSELVELKKLKSLTITKFAGKEMPIELGGLTALEELIITHTDLAVLPDFVMSLPNLKRLSINHTYQRITIPPTIEQLQHLEEFVLEGTGTQIIFPPEFFNLKNLKLLDISDMRLDAVPREIGQLKSLEALYYCADKIPEEICHLPNLKCFFYGGVPLKELPPSIDKLLCKGFIKIKDVEHMETIETLYNKELLHRGFEIVQSYKIYDQKISYMEVTTHHFRGEATVEQIPNEEFKELYQDIAYGIIGNMFSDKYDDMSDEEIEFERYLQGKYNDV